ncbi:MAG TPA: FAD-binding protein [Fimbriimonadaceae bacterium]|nr:FAD-binding protein [Fimbriimonadaceae bacterium]
MAKLLIVAFHPAELDQAAGFATELGLPYDALLLTGEGSMEGATATLLANLDEVPPADGLAGAVAKMADGYSHVAAVSSMAAKDLLARVAGLLDAAMVSDAIGLDSPTVFRRPMVAGSLVATVEVLAEPVVLTFRPSGFAAQSSAEPSPTRPISLEAEGSARRVSVTARGGARPDLTQAKVVVSGGRPLKDKDTFEKVLGGLADALGGAVGATRAAVDSGIAPNELQVGQTGKIVAPDLYIAAGVSGSTQHMAGIKDSKVIVAINKDPDAPIFEFADYGLVADLFEAVPELERKVRQGG